MDRLTKDKTTMQNNPPIGRALHFTYGESTGLFIGENELRIGHEYSGYRLVLSTRQGEFPIRPALFDGQEKYFSDLSELKVIAKQLASKHRAPIITIDTGP